MHSSRHTLHRISAFIRSIAVPECHPRSAGLVRLYTNKPSSPQNTSTSTSHSNPNPNSNQQKDNTFPTPKPKKYFHRERNGYYTKRPKQQHHQDPTSPELENEYIINSIISARSKPKPFYKQPTHKPNNNRHHHAPHVSMGFMEGTPESLRPLLTELETAIRYRNLSKVYDLYTQISTNRNNLQYLPKNIWIGLMNLPTAGHRHANLYNLFNRLGEKMIQDLMELGINLDSAGLTSSILLYCNRVGLRSLLERVLTQIDKTLFTIENITCVMGAYAKLGRHDKVLEWLDWVYKLDLEPDAYVYTVVIQSFTKANRMEDAQRWFDRMLRDGLKPTHMTYIVMLDGYAQIGDMDNALVAFQQMENKGKIQNTIWNTLLHGFLKKGDLNKVKETYNDMLNHGIQPDRYTFNILLNAFGSSGDLESMLRMYKMQLSQGVPPNAMAYNAVMQAFNSQNRPDEVFTIYEAMKKDNVSPDDPTFSALVDAHRLKNEYEEIANLWFDNRRVIQHSDSSLYAAIVHALGFEPAPRTHVHRVFNDMLQCHENAINPPFELSFWTTYFHTLFREGNYKRFLEIYNKHVKSKFPFDYLLGVTVFRFMCLGQRFDHFEQTPTKRFIDFLINNRRGFTSTLYFQSLGAYFGYLIENGCEADIVRIYEAHRNVFFDTTYFRVVVSHTLPKTANRRGQFASHSQEDGNNELVNDGESTQPEPIVNTRPRLLPLPRYYERLQHCLHTLRTQTRSLLLIAQALTTHSRPETISSLFANWNREANFYRYDFFASFDVVSQLISSKSHLLSFREREIITALKFLIISERHNYAGASLDAQEDKYWMYWLENGYNYFGTHVQTVHTLLDDHGAAFELEKYAQPLDKRAFSIRWREKVLESLMRNRPNNEADESKWSSLVLQVSKQIFTPLFTNNDTELSEALINHFKPFFQERIYRHLVSEKAFTGLLTELPRLLPFSIDVADIDALVQRTVTERDWGSLAVFLDMIPTESGYEFSAETMEILKQRISLMDNFATLKKLLNELLQQYSVSRNDAIPVVLSSVSNKNFFEQVFVSFVIANDAYSILPCFVTCIRNWESANDGFVVDEGLWNVLVTAMKDSKNEEAEEWVKYVTEHVLKRD